MAKYVPLLEVIPLSVGKEVEDVMFHTLEQNWQLFAYLRALSHVTKCERVADRASLLRSDSERKENLWEKLMNEEDNFKSIEDRSDDLILLPFWTLEMSAGSPVFHYSVNLKDYRYKCNLKDIYVDQDKVPPLAKPIPEDAVCKLETDWNLQSLQQAFIAMAEKGWVTPEAPYTVPKRFTNSKSREVVQAEAEMFDWLESQTLLSQVCGKFSVQKSYVSIHFLHKGRPLRKEFYRSGVKPTQRKVIDEAHNLLKSYQP